MEIELNFRLDCDGRTAPPVTVVESSSSPLNDDVPKESTTNETTPPTQHQEEVLMNYQSRALMTNLAPPSRLSMDATNNDDNNKEYHNCMDELLYDCEITDCGLMPRTFWMPADSSILQPRCSLEQFALDVFHQHVPANLNYDKSKSGAEWWVQIRPSPEGIGRYSMFDNDNDNENDKTTGDKASSQSMSKTGISFHWDKDEDLRLLTGGNTYIHPHLSTVTYLTDLGAPTFILNCRIHNLTGEWIIPSGSGKNNDKEEDNSDLVQGFVSWPRAGKHICFDGRYLHAAPPNFMEDGEFDKQCKFEINENDKISGAKKEKMMNTMKRRHRRVTFLVNIWLNYHPFEVKPFPESMINKLSGSHGVATTTRTTTEEEDVEVKDNEKNDIDEKRTLKFLIPTPTSTTTLSSPSYITKATRLRHVTVESEEVVREVDTTSTTHVASKPISCTWPLGDCGSNERLSAETPLTSIRREAKNGGNIHIVWKPVTCDNGSDKDNGKKPIFGLYRGQEEPKLKDTTTSAAAATITTTSTTPTAIESATLCMDGAAKRKEVPGNQNDPSNKHPRFETGN